MTGLCIVAFAVFLCAARQAKALILQVACEATPLVSVVAEHHPPDVRSSYTLGQLRALAAQAGHEGRHPPLGFYAGTFGYSVDVQEQGVNQTGCSKSLRVVLRMFIGARLVEVGSGGPCHPEAVASHYMLHAQDDDRLLSHYAAKATAMLDGLSQAGSLSGASQESRQTVERRVVKAMDALLGPYDADRKQALTTADTDDELAQLRQACGRTI